MKMNFKKLIPKRRKNSHKGDYGSILVIAGSRGMSGAAVLCCKACFYTGCGLVTLGIPEGLNDIMEMKLTETITKPLPQTSVFSLSQKAYKDILNLSRLHDVFVIGPGLSRNEQTQKLVKKLISSIQIPMIIDADGVNALKNDVGIFKKIHNITVITPHPGEMSRLLKIPVEKLQRNRLKFAKQFSSNYNIIVVLKGYKTIVASKKSPGYINDTGNPGMATAGSGDVLTGMIAGFMAQRIAPFDASRLAVYLHGLAGDLAAEEKGEISIIASDILEKVPEAIKTLINN